MSKPGKENLFSRKEKVRTFRPLDASGLPVVLPVAASQIVPPEGLTRAVSALRIMEVAGAAASFNIYALPPGETTPAVQHKILPTTSLSGNQGYSEVSGEFGVIELKRNWSIWADAPTGSVVLYVNMLDERTSYE